MSHVAVYKSRAAEFLDQLYAGGGHEVARDLIARHKNELAGSTEELNENHGLAREAGNREAFENYWLAPGSRFGKDVDRLLANGYEQALAIAGDTPIETFWVTGATDEFEVHICTGERVVSVFMFIPVERRYGSRNAVSQSFVVRAGGPDEGDAQVLDPNIPPIVMEQVSGPR